MLFSSPTFIFIFLPLVLLLHTLLCKYFCLRNMFAANIFLAMVSLLFYSWGEPKHLLILVSSSLLNYICGILIYNISSHIKRTLYLGLGVSLNLILLVYFKYAGFLYDITVAFGCSPRPEWNFLQQIALPLGISFYTFQGISYIVDIYRKTIEAQRSFADFLCYLAMFPQLVAGPIVRYGEIASTIGNRTVTAEHFAEGVRRFVVGLAKKTLLADTFARVADAAFATPAGTLGGEAAWLGIICYTLQIYYDFSGYSDMAIGLGRMLGFQFPENFNYPYISRSIQEFWRRWHLTLSRWLKDYLYIPLGGNRCALWRNCLNLIIVFALCGLWHGATLGFLFWGLYHGGFLIAERLFPALFRSMPRFIQHCYILIVVMAGWVLFRSQNIDAAYEYFRALLFLNSSTVPNASVWLAAHGYALPLCILLGMLFAVPVIPKIQALMIRLIAQASPVFGNITYIIYDTLLFSLLGVSLMVVFGSTYLSFIYFRF